MFDFLSIKKEKESVTLLIKYKKKVKLQEKFFNMDESLARKIILENEPSLNIELNSIKNMIADNKKNLSGEWTFRFADKQTKPAKKLSKKQQREALDELVNLSQEMGSYDKELVTDLTSDVERATIEETTEKVQEPTE